MKLNKSLLIKVAAAAVTIALIFGAVMFLLDYLSYKTVTFNLSPDTKSVKVYSSTYFKDKDTSGKPTELASLSNSGSTRLKPGLYYAVPYGDKITSVPIKIEVKDETKDISINPYFSGDYLKASLSPQIATINQIIRNKYPGVINTYTIKDGMFYHFGEWYSTTLFNNSPNGREGVDTYSVILHKNGDSWQIAASPKIVFSYNDYKDIPRDIIDMVNRGVSSY